MPGALLKERGWPEEIIRAVGGHAFYTGIEWVTPLQKAILAADELTGFVGAGVLVRPTKKLADLPVESVVKRLKEKPLARTVDQTRRGVGRPTGAPSTAAASGAAPGPAAAATAIRSPRRP